MDQLAEQTFKLHVAAQGPKGIREALIAQGEDADDDTVDDVWRDLRNFDWTLSLHQNDQLRESLQLAAELAVDLLPYPVSLVTFERRRLLTSDCPISLLRYADDWQGAGLLNSDEIWVPLSRTAAALLSQPGCPAAELTPTIKLERHINQLTVFSAERWLYHHPDDDPCVGLVLEPLPVGIETRGVSPQDVASIDDDPDNIGTLEPMEAERVAATPCCAE